MGCLLLCSTQIFRNLIRKRDSFGPPASVFDGAAGACGHLRYIALTLSRDCEAAF